ncbi:hypothetical protein E5D57_008994 [Metarhizium anisopliae]|nr:hypothetical protein E5D57_008994 [Metarhizium anisopliae]
MRPGYEVQASLCRILSVTQTKTVPLSGLRYQVVVRASMTLKTQQLFPVEKECSKAGIKGGSS